MIAVKELVKLHGRLRVLNHVSMPVHDGEIAAIIGPSGSGKSSLLRCINGLDSFQGGEIRVGDLCLRPSNCRPDSSLQFQKLRRMVGMVFQQFHLFPHLSVLENVMAGPRFAAAKHRCQAEETARRLLARVGLADKIDARPDQLSGGQQQRVAIARALAVSPQAILFDEPTSALDPRMAGEVLSVIADLAGAGQTMVVVTHAMGFARKVAQSVHVMHEGRIVESGGPSKIFEDPTEEITKTFLAETINQ